MKKQFLALLAALPVLVFPLCGWAQFNFTTNNGAIAVTGYTGTNGEVIIPDTINGLPVTSIQYVAFSYANVASVIIPNNVTNIGSGAFQDCGSLTNVIIGTNVTTIESFAFYACASLPSITIPSSVTNIAGWVLNDCPALMEITVDTNNPAYSSVDGILYDKSQTTLIQYPGGKPGSYTIPGSVTSIADGAFYVCTGLTNVTIPSSITSVGGYAFENCYSLVSVTIPDTVISIEDGAFANTSLTSITIPNHITSIGNDAFSGCGNLTNVMIPNSVTSIGESAFGGCGNLTAITVDAANSVYCSVDDVLLNKSQTAIVEYPSGKGGSYTVPGSVTNIGPYVFFECANLTSVTIPNSVTSIGVGAFAFCYNLTSVTLSDRVTSIAASTFNNCVSLTNITIPNGVTSIDLFVFNACTNLAGIYFQGNAPSLGGILSHQTNSIVYYLPGTKGWSSPFGGLTARLWNPQPQTSDGSFGVQNNLFGFRITGTANIPIVVETCTNLGGAWVPLQTCAVTNGSIYFSDPSWTNYPNRFYRIRSP